ncbi:hypothetical protein J6590_067664 [Homalodisca vitripennis]|nr:hypothetical protein J6590_067664 [Homalodisca vitripennis]
MRGLARLRNTPPLTLHTVADILVTLIRVQGHAADSTPPYSRMNVNNISLKLEVTVHVNICRKVDSEHDLIAQVRPVTAKSAISL